LAYSPWSVSVLATPEQPVNLPVSWLWSSWPMAVTTLTLEQSTVPSSGSVTETV
jgi:hypothetical protein